MTENSSETVQFLASSLAKFMATNRHNNQKWTKFRVAEYITGWEKISGSISDTTIGRFLDPSYKQEPSVATVRMVKEFLILFNWVSEKQLELFKFPKEVQAAAMLADFFSTGDVKNQEELHGKLDGHYASYVARAPYVLETRLFVTNHDKEKLLTCYETLTLFKIRDTNQFQTLSEGFHRGSFTHTPSLIKIAGGNEIARHVLSGAAVANSGMITFIMKPLTSGFASVISLDAVNMDEEDNICAISGARNRGWLILDEGETLAPYEDVSNSSPYNAMRYLSGKVQYYPQLLADIQSMRVADTEQESDDDIREFANSGEFSPTAKLQEKKRMDKIDKIISECDSMNDKLRLSIEWGSLEHFVEALENGANANLILQDSNLPIVFYLAGTGRYEWVEALVETGKCDLTVTDHDGLPPSHNAGVLAREMASKGGPDHQMKEFGKVADYLLAEEIKQAKPKPSTILPPAR